MSNPVAVSSAPKTFPDIADHDVIYTKKLPFGVICDMLSIIGSTNKRAVKRGVLEKLLTKYRTYYLYPIMRLILPHLDRDRQTYSLKESKLAKIFIQILAIAKDSSDALRMVNWRQPQRNAATGKHEGGDFAEAVYNSIRTRCASHSTSTVASINAHLDALNAAIDSTTRAQVLTSMVREATAQEMKWVVRIILKDLKIGISEGLVFEVFHEDATELYNITSSMYIVCNKLRDPTVRLSHEGISLFNPIKPMLAGRKLPEDIGTLMATEDRKFVIEQKFDGERIQVHKDGNVIRFFSRNSLEVTDIYPMIRGPLIRAIKAKQAIIDGELLVWDRETGQFEPFGKMKTQATSEKAGMSTFDGRDKKQFCFMAFDILYLEGEAKMNMPLKTRMEILASNITVTEKVVELVVQTEAKNEYSLIEALNTAIDLRHEGIMVKDFNSVYIPNERKDKWIKLKPEYMDGIGDTLDLIILGGYYGSGVRKAASISHFLLGVRKSPGVFWSVARVGSGYSDTELRAIQTMLQNYWKPYNPSNPPKCMQLAETGLKDVPNVWIEPKYSRVLEILVAQITPSEKYKAGYTLRFPRVKGVRMDKMAEQVTTMDELLEMVNHYESRATRNKITQPKEIKSSKKSKGDSIFSTHHFAGLALAKLDQHPTLDYLRGLAGNLFEKKEFCVINGDDVHRKEFVESLIKNQQGIIVQNPTPKTFAVIAGKLSVNTQIMQHKGTHNIVWVKWIIYCITKGALIPLEPRFMIYTEPKTAESFIDEIDPWGDSYERSLDEASLRDIFDNMCLPWALKKEEPSTSDEIHKKLIKIENSSAPPLSSVPQLKTGVNEFQELLDMEKECFGVPWWAMFRGCIVYVDRYRTISSAPRETSQLNLSVFSDSTDNTITYQADIASQSSHDGSMEVDAIFACPLDIANSILLYFGAVVVNHITLSGSLTHILVDDNDTSRLPVLKNFVRQFELRGQNPYIVNQQWLDACIERKKVLTAADMFDVEMDSLLMEDHMEESSDESL